LLKQALSDYPNGVARYRCGWEQLGEVLFEPERGWAHVRALVQTFADEAAQIAQAFTETNTTDNLEIQV
jgi:hypothetical protein